ncbi:MFS transporter [Oharaeibacter diazotrophicus]|uniref:Putative MFS family arabinose efflux permease n=1 Tax=Oharaeibacter diazotrophicus TaxID=1920512 RepID=A0A4R6RD20_9HYPH|nr:MFS transporter [Oharaeibacter diazotrophicus]TDP84073.1 putative MFS family arabinose efflux permease [Oharaeibacter diazotrophicus]BBE73112.1 major facilitator superfamily protein [Pleomorphomonas sp. SM30]GLS74901.1 MFS transporter [Oharaeibacter diazotrophicus]
MLAPSRSSRSSGRASLIGLLALSQIVGWGTTFDMPAALGRAMAADLGVPLSGVMLGLSAMMGAGALAGPAVGRALVRHGAADVLAVGSITMAGGLFLMAAATAYPFHLAAWVVVGLGGAMALTTGAHTAVAERRPGDARETITLLMLLTGLSATVFLPILAAAEATVGWRVTLMACGLVQLLVAAPLHAFALPRAARTGPGAVKAGGKTAPFVPTKRPRLAFALIAAVLAVSAFVSFGLSPMLPTLLAAKGLTPEQAIGVATARGAIGVSARALDFAAAGVVGPIVSAILAAGLVAVSFVALGLERLDLWHAGGFVAAYAIGTGIMAVVRSTLPLVFFRREDYGLHMGRLALPQNMTIALAPAAFAAFVDAGRIDALADLCLALSSLTVAALVGLALVRWDDRHRLTGPRPA